MNKYFRLVDASNTHNSALITLRELGFELEIVPPSLESEEETEIGMGFWRARTEGREFEASDPLTLLGLVAIWRHRGDDWARDEDPDIYDELLEDAYPD